MKMPHLVHIEKKSQEHLYVTCGAVKPNRQPNAYHMQDPRYKTNRFLSCRNSLTHRSPSLRVCFNA
jgi:hypothetical protein